MIPILVLLGCYLIGGIPFGYLLVKLRSGEDVRSTGSGNIGATNVLRSYGRAMGVATLLLDVVKGWVAVWMADYFTHGDPLWLSLAALAVMAGHAYPVFLHFRGGKAVASFIGAFLYIAPLPLLAVLIVFVITVAVRKHISLGSIVAAGSFPAAVFLIQHPPMPVFLASLVAGVFIVIRHKSNIERIRAGNESVFSFRGPRG